MKIRKKLKENYLKLNKDFEVLFEILNVRYRYGFEITNKEVVSEWLFESKKNAADAKGYLVATKSGFETQSSPIN